MARACADPFRRGAAKLAVALALGASQAIVEMRVLYAAEHEVNTRGNQWVPVVLFVEPGDTIVFRGMESHETELIEGFGPRGATRWQSELDEEGFTITLHEAGAYVYKCHVHLHAGMVGAIVVGDGMPGNLDAIGRAASGVGAGRAFVGRVIGRLKRELRRRGDL